MDEASFNKLYQEAQCRLKSRLSQKRYAHSISVAKMAYKLAATYGVDEQKAGIAGLLHDWDKCLNDEEARQRADDLGVEVEEYVYKTMPHLLHGITAASALVDEFPTLPSDVLQAIARHTSGAIDMSELDMVVYVADVIEPHRPYGDMEHLRAAIGEVSLEELFLRTFKQVFAHLITSNYRIHPDTGRVWNYYVYRARQRKNASKDIEMP